MNTCVFCEAPAAYHVEFPRDDGPAMDYCEQHIDRLGGAS
jgi:hypothetical protein